MVSAQTYNRKQIWLGGGALLGVVILLLGWFMVISPELTDAAATRDQVEAAGTQNLALEAKNARLAQQNDDVAALRDSLAAALAELPSDGGLPAFTRQLSAQATASSVTLSSVVVGATSAATDTAAVAAPDATATDATAPAPAATAAGGLVQITITVAAGGLGRDLLTFLSEIQVTGPRRALVTSTAFAPAEGGAGSGLDATSTLNLTMTIFSAPLAPADQAALEKLLSGS